MSGGVVLKHYRSSSIACGFVHHPASLPDLIPHRTHAPAGLAAPLHGLFVAPVDHVHYSLLVAELKCVRHTSVVKFVNKALKCLCICGHTQILPHTFVLLRWVKRVIDFVPSY